MYCHIRKCLIQHSTTHNGYCRRNKLIVLRNTGSQTRLWLIQVKLTILCDYLTKTIYDHTTMPATGTTWYDAHCCIAVFEHHRYDYNLPTTAICDHQCCTASRTVWDGHGDGEWLQRLCNCIHTQRRRRHGCRRRRCHDHTWLLFANCCGSILCNCADCHYNTCKYDYAYQPLYHSISIHNIHAPSYPIRLCEKGQRHTI
jgi:hypothetical protein